MGIFKWKLIFSILLLINKYDFNQIKLNNLIIIPKTIDDKNNIVNNRYTSNISNIITKISKYVKIINKNINIVVSNLYEDDYLINGFYYIIRLENNIVLSKKSFKLKKKLIFKNFGLPDIIYALKRKYEKNEEFNLNQFINDYQKQVKIIIFQTENITLKIGKCFRSVKNELVKKMIYNFFKNLNIEMKLCFKKIKTNFQKFQKIIKEIE